MKEYRFLALFLVMFAGCLFSSLQAQENLQRWVKSCEKESSVDMTVISKKDPKTKKEISKSISISFENNPKLLKELREACQKDKENAINIIERVSGGQLNPSIYKFSNGAAYYFTINENAVTVFTKISDVEKD